MSPCPLCGSSEFRDFSGRSSAVCASCGALERHRALARVGTELFAAGVGRRCLEAGPLNPRVYGGFLRERGWEYVSIDRWSTGNPRDPRAVGFIDHEVDLRDLRLFGDGSFDLFITQHVLEEIPEVDEALSEIARILRPGGHAFLEVPYDERRPTSERTPPNDFGNVWRFGADLPQRVERHFAEVLPVPLEHYGWNGRLIACAKGR